MTLPSLPQMAGLARVKSLKMGLMSHNRLQKQLNIHTLMDNSSKALSLHPLQSKITSFLKSGLLKGDPQGYGKY